jgi:hypothetical protein
MFFLIRCAFWLTIVYAVMFWPKDFDPKSAAEIFPKARHLADDAVGHARDEIVKSCVSAPAACLGAAGYLNLPAAVGKKARATSAETGDRP